MDNNDHIYLDDQGGAIMRIVREDVSPCLLLNAARSHGLIVLTKKKKCGDVIAFAQNTRNEVRILGSDGQVAGALAAEPGMKQQTYLVVKKKVPHRTNDNHLNGAEAK
jgi:hypothetical protein